MRLFIEPVEPLLLRTGRPFVAGENNFAESLFPPTPETIQGAIRATLATHLRPNTTPAEAFAEADVRELIGDRERCGRFRITGITLGRYEKAGTKRIARLFPAPASLFQEQGGAERQLRLLLRPQEQGLIHTNLSNDMQLLYFNVPDPGHKIEPLKGWLTEGGLQQFLRKGGDVPAKEIVNEKDIYTKENRLGIGINSAAKAAEEGMLYQVQMIRMNHNADSDFIYGFVVDIRLSSTTQEGAYIDDSETQEKLRLPNEGWMILGGERRAARFEVVPSSQESIDNLKSGKMLYLATPAALSRGWRPDSWSKLLDSDISPIAVAIDRYQPIGGWSQDPNNSGGYGKTMRRCVPAGTVYYFEKEIAISRPFTDHGSEIGYGIAYVGEYER